MFLQQLENPQQLLPKILLKRSKSKKTKEKNKLTYLNKKFVEVFPNFNPNELRFGRHFSTTMP